MAAGRVQQALRRTAELVSGQVGGESAQNVAGVPQTQIGRLLNPTPRAVIGVVGCTLLVLWCIWWVNSLRQNRLVSVHRTWIGVPCFGTDFYRNLDRPTRIWMAGGDPYADKQQLFCYPPLVTRLFAWTTWMTPRAALAVWVTAMGVIAAAGAWVAWRARCRLRLQRIPLVLALIAILFSSSVMFAMERGNYDLVCIPVLIAGWALMKRRSKYTDILAGIVLAVAPWAKVYPGLLAVGLVGLRRWRVLASFVVAGAAIGLANLDETLRWLENNDLHIAGVYQLAEAFPEGPIWPWQHSLTECWPRIWMHTPLHWLGWIPGSVAAACLLTPLLAWVTYRVYRCPKRSRLAYPYLLWVLALATFVPPVANDYNLFFLPMAAVAVWDRRDPLLVHLAMALLLLWWQPLLLPIGGRILLPIKLCGLAAVAVSLSERACELSQFADRRQPQFPEILTPGRAAA